MFYSSFLFSFFILIPLNIHGTAFIGWVSYVLFFFPSFLLYSYAFRYSGYYFYLVGWLCLFLFPLVLQLTCFRWQIVCYHLLGCAFVHITYSASLLLLHWPHERKQLEEHVMLVSVSSLARFCLYCKLSYYHIVTLFLYTN